MTSDELADAFEGGILDPRGFGHREHLEVAWTLLQRHGRADGERRMLDGIKRLAVRVGRPDRFDAPLTRAWMAAVGEAAIKMNPASTFEDVLAAAPWLLDRQAVGPVRSRG